MNFASDNAAPVAPEILAALSDANSGPAMGYGNDDLTRRAEDRFKEVFDCDLRAFPVATGTAANSLALSVMVPPYGSVYAHRLGHIELDECGAPEFYTGGAKIVLMDGEDGKLGPEDLDQTLSTAGVGVVHHVQPAAVSITQVTECGTIYTPLEVAAIGDVAKRHKLGLHMDGARFANAVAALECAPADVTWRAGVDILSFGGTKNGAMAVEAVIFFDTAKAQEFEFRRKRGAHLFSKMRYLSAQLDAALNDNLWLKMARNANAMAKKLGAGIAAKDQAYLVYPTEANMIFAKISEAACARLNASNILFYPNGPAENCEIRLVCSWNTSDDDVQAVLDLL
ncbi:MAG: low specificity L-threonine aldolase [Sneathiella sp.]|nr:MAG: low specificity L-threonine aldolase [Sneathiella sp.]